MPIRLNFESNNTVYISYERTDDQNSQYNLLQRLVKVHGPDTCSSCAVMLLHVHVLFQSHAYRITY